VTHQLEVGQSTLNDLPEFKYSAYFGQYLPKLFIKPYKLTSFSIKNLICASPVYRLFFGLNIIFLLAILTLIAFGAHSWVYPKYPSKVDGESFINSSPKIAHLTIKRQSSTPQSVSKIVANNLFRKERIEYIPPIQQQPIVKVVRSTPRSMLPMPKIILRGVILLNGIKIAVLEGSYPIQRENKIEDIPIKRKGYYLGDQLGNYKISQIRKRAIILNSDEGKIIEIKLKRDIASINKKSKRKKRKPKFTSTRKITKKNPQLSPRISGTISAPPRRQHISGR